MPDEERRSYGATTGVFSAEDYDTEPAPTPKRPSLLGPSVVSPRGQRPSSIIEEEDIEASIPGESIDLTVRRHMQKSQNTKDRRESIKEWKYAQAFEWGKESPETREFEGHKGSDALSAEQDYLANDPEAAFIQPDPTIAGDPAMDTGEPSSTAQNVINFMFSDEMGLLGLKWDAEGFAWNYENFKNQITEHPYSTAFTIATYMVPIGAAWAKSSRIAKRAATLAAQAGEPAAAAGKGIWGTKYLRHRFDDHTTLVKSLAFSDVNDGRKLFDDQLIAKLRNATPDEVAKLIPQRELRKILIGDFHQERFFQLRNLAKRGELNTPALRASHAMWKAFGNKYLKAVSDTSKEAIETMDKFFEKANLGRYLGALPTNLGDEGNKAVYKYWSGNLGYNDLAKQIGDESSLAVDAMKAKWTELFDNQVTEGFVDDATAAMFRGEFAGFHLPAIKKGTRGFADMGVTSKILAPSAKGGLVARDVLDPVKVLQAPTMLKRSKFDTNSAVMENLHLLETDPQLLGMGGFIRDNQLFQIHRTFRDIVVNGLSGEAKYSQWFVSEAALAGMPKYAQKNWMSFEELNKVVPGLYERMHKMVSVEATKRGMDPALTKGALPAIDRHLVEQFFGHDGSMRQQAGAFQKFFELLTGVHKTSRTALNPPTHMSNLIGNFMFLSMAGMNPFSVQALNDGKVLTKAFTQLAKRANRTADKAAAGKGGAVWDSIESMMNKEDLSKIFGKDRFIKGVGGKNIDLAELFSDDLMKNLIEAQSFESVEGLTHVTKLLDRLEKAEKGGWGTAAVATVARAIAGVGEVKPVKATLHAMSSAYLGEDMIPKMMYAMHLSRKGWGRDAILREVGRRLPQYLTVGDLPKATRRVILPWITFPAEATRIMKNNMMDNPLNMMVWMQSPQIARGMLSGLDLGPDFSEMDALIEASPPWAVRYQTAFVDEKSAPTTLGAVGGGMVGGFAGAAVGGAKGAVAGAVGGAIAGAAIGTQSPRSESLTQDDQQEYNRAWTMDFLPQSSLFLGSFHPHEWEKLNPFDPTPVSGKESWQTAKDLSPVEPFAVFMPLLELYSGRGSFGRELESRSGMEFANKMATGLLGFLAPPMIQKYGMKLEGEGGAYYRMGDLHEANGGQMTLPREVTATFGGLAAGGLTFLGAKTGLGAKGGALLASTALSATAGAMTGHQVNTRRLMTDLGIMGDPRTGEYGDWTLDFFANTFTGVNKSWRVSPAQAEFNQNMRSKRIAEPRGVSVKAYMDAIRHGRESTAKTHLAAIYKSFLYEWNMDVDVAKRKFLKWGERHSRMLMTLPVFSGMSEDYLETRIQALRSTIDEATKMERQQFGEMLTEKRMRYLRRAKGVKVVK